MLIVNKESCVPLSMTLMELKRRTWITLTIGGILAWFVVVPALRCQAAKNATQAAVDADQENLAFVISVATRCNDPRL